MSASQHPAPLHHDVSSAVRPGAAPAVARDAGLRRCRRGAAALAVSIATAVCALPVQAQSEPATTVAAGELARAYADALAEYEVGHYAAAYGRFAHLANRGHSEAARIAWLMYTYGPTLYRTEWDATPAQQREWKELAQVDGRRHLAQAR